MLSVYIDISVQDDLLELSQAPVECMGQILRTVKGG